MTEDELKEIFVKRLRHYVQLSGKQQKEIAKDIGESPTTFNNWCTGTSMPRMSKIAILADYFRIPKSDLLYENGADTDTKIRFLIEKLSPSSKEHLLSYLMYLQEMENKNEG